MHPFAGNVVVASETAGLSNAHVAVAQGMFCARVTDNLRRKELWVYTKLKQIVTKPATSRERRAFHNVYTNQLVAREARKSGVKIISHTSKNRANYFRLTLTRSNHFSFISVFCRVENSAVFP